MSETRKLAAIVVTDFGGYSRLAGADEGRTLARLRGLRSDPIDPAIAAKSTDGSRLVTECLNDGAQARQADQEANAGDRRKGLACRRSIDSSPRGLAFVRRRTRDFLDRAVGPNAAPFGVSIPIAVN